MEKLQPGDVARYVLLTEHNIYVRLSMDYPTGWTWQTAAFCLFTAFGLISGCSASDRPVPRVRIDGSSNVFLISEAVTEEFLKQHPDIQVTVGASGTGGGFEKLLRGEIDISGASRPISASERRLAKKNDIGYIELLVARDGIAVIGNASSSWIECLTIKELQKVWKKGSDISNWNEIRPSFPERPLHLYGAAPEQGTYYHFSTTVIGKSGATRTDYTVSPDDNVLLQGVANDSNALGFVGLGFYRHSADRLHLIGINDEQAENGRGCVKPSRATISNGAYQPLLRPLYIYINAQAARSTAVQLFVNFYLDRTKDLVHAAGYVPLPDSIRQRMTNRFKNRITGSFAAENPH